MTRLVHIGTGLMSAIGISGSASVSGSNAFAVPLQSRGRADLRKRPGLEGSGAAGGLAAGERPARRLALAVRLCCLRLLYQGLLCGAFGRGVGRGTRVPHAPRYSRPFRSPFPWLHRFRSLCLNEGNARRIEYYGLCRMSRQEREKGVRGRQSETASDW